LACDVPGVKLGDDRLERRRVGSHQAYGVQPWRRDGSGEARDLSGWTRPTAPVARFKTWTDIDGAPLTKFVVVR
jgi:hypothetical protein